MADKLMYFKYVCKNVAKRHGKTVTFMPKPLFGDNGSGMHTHQSIWKEASPSSRATGTAECPKLAMRYIGGILKHAPALAAITNPTTNSYKRLVPGFEAPGEPGILEPKPVGFHPDPHVLARRPRRSGSSAASPILLQSVHGLRRDADGRAGRGREQDRSGRAARQGHLRPDAGGTGGRPDVPGSLEEALDNLEADHEFLLKGDVFTQRRDRHLDRVQEVEEVVP